MKTIDQIIEATGATQGAKFKSADAVREYMKAENIEEIFGSCDISQSDLDRAAEYMIEHRVHRQMCECPSCECDEVATTTDDGNNDVCEACADYAKDDDGETYCSKHPRYVDDGEWSGGGMHGIGMPGWVSKPRVRPLETDGDDQ